MRVRPLSAAIPLLALIFVASALIQADRGGTAIAQTPVAFSGTAPQPGGIGLLVAAANAPPSELVASLRNAGCEPTTLALLTGGIWAIYVVGAPAVVNASFPAALAATTPFFVRCEEAGPTAAVPPTPTPTSVPQMVLASSAFAGGAMIPARYTCDGVDVSPPLTIANLPAEAVMLALIVDDPDAPGGTWDHWVEFNIAVTNAIPEDAGTIGTLGANSWGETGYRGPCPPSGTHRYFFKLYALDAELDLPPSATKQQLEQAMEGRILAQTELIGLYSYSP